MDGTTFAACPQSFGCVESLKQRRQVRHDVCDMGFHAMDTRVALQAEPFETVQQPFRPTPFDHKPDTAWLGTLG